MAEAAKSKICLRNSGVSEMAVWGHAVLFRKVGGIWFFKFWTQGIWFFDPYVLLLGSAIGRH